MKRSRFKIVFVLVIIISMLCFGMGLVNSYFGWYGYEKWKYRRSTFGNKTESIERKVFIKELEFHSSIDLDSFHIYIEKGYKFGHHSSRDTRLVTDSKYPFQVSYEFRDKTKLISYEISNKNTYDSIDNITIFLRKPYMKDTLKMGIYKYSSKKWDSIGYLKVWDKPKWTIKRGNLDSSDMSSER